MTIKREDYLTPNEAGDRMGVSGQTVRRWAEQGRLPAAKTPGGRYLIHRDDAVIERVNPPASGDGSA